MRPWTRILAALLVAVVASGCGSGRNSTEDPAASVVPSPTNQARLDEIAEAVRALGETKYAEFFAGVAIDIAADRVDLWTKDSPEFTAEVTRSFGGQVRIFPATYSRLELLPAFEQIVIQDRDYWQSRGLPVNESYIPPDCSCIQVGTPDPARAELEFRHRYPQEPMCFFLKTEAGVGFGESRG